MLSPAEMSLIRQQNAAITPLGYAFGAELLARAFWAHGWLRGQFPPDVFALRSAIPGILDDVVALVDRPEALAAHLAALVAQAGGPVEPKAAAILAEALVDTLRSRLETEFTAEAEAAWRQLLQLIEPLVTEPNGLSHAA